MSLRATWDQRRREEVGGRTGHPTLGASQWLGGLSVGPLSWPVFQSSLANTPPKSPFSLILDSTEESLESNDILWLSLTSQGSQELRVHSSDVGRTSWALTEHAPTALWVTVLHWSTALFLAFEDWDQISVLPTEESKSTFLSTGAFLQNLLKWAGCPLPLLPPLAGLNTDTNSKDLAHGVASSVTLVQPS